jgi:hypothetical protein
MQLVVFEKHDGEGELPLFSKGTAVNSFAPVDDNSHWFSCVLNDHNTYIPETFVTEGVLNRDYNPTELVALRGQTVTLLNIIFEWVYVRDESGREGWLPASKVVSECTTSQAPVS